MLATPEGVRQEAGGAPHYGEAAPTLRPRSRALLKLRPPRRVASSREAPRALTADLIVFYDGASAELANLASLTACSADRAEGGAMPTFSRAGDLALTAAPAPPRFGPCTWTLQNDCKRHSRSLFYAASAIWLTFLRTYRPASGYRTERNRLVASLDDSWRVSDESERMRVHH